MASEEIDMAIDINSLLTLFFSPLNFIQEHLRKIGIIS